MKIDYICPVCKTDCVVKCILIGWGRHQIDIELDFKVKLSTKQKVSHNVLLCSTDCYTQYREAKDRANEAYNKVMEPYNQRS